MKVLHLINNLNRGGIEMWLLTMLKTLPREQYQMDVCCWGSSIGPMASEIQNLGVNIHHIPFGPFHIGFFLQLRKLIQTWKYDVLHNHMETYSGFAVWIAQKCDLPVISSYHNTRWDPQTPFTRRPGIRQFRKLYGNYSIRYAIKNSDYVTGCSTSVIDSLPITYPKEKTQVLYYGVHIPPQPSPEELIKFRSSFGWAANVQIIIHVGRFLEQKNHSAILNIFEQVHQENPLARLLLVGDGILRPIYETKVRDARLNNYIRFLGLRQDVPHLLSHSDLFLMPSLYEGFGLAALEASASGLPVIATRTSGLMEAVDDGETGLLFDHNDVDGMVDAIIKLLRNSEKRRKMGELGRKRVETIFSVQASVQQLSELYDACDSSAQRPIRN